MRAAPGRVCMRRLLRVEVGGGEEEGARRRGKARVEAAARDRGGDCATGGSFSCETRRYPVPQSAYLMRARALRHIMLYESCRGVRGVIPLIAGFDFKKLAVDSWMLGSFFFRVACII